MSKIVFASAGGVSSLVCIRWLNKVLGAKVISLMCNIGQDIFFDPLSEHTMNAGASEVNIIDARDSFLMKYCFPYLNSFPDSTYYPFASYPLGLTVVGYEMIKVAKNEGTANIALGGFESSESSQILTNIVKSLIPEAKIIFPLTHLQLNTTADVLKFAEDLKLSTSDVQHKKLNVSQNIWGTTITSQHLKDFWNAPGEDTRVLTVNRQGNNLAPKVIDLSFKGGVPIAIDNQLVTPSKLMETLNSLAGQYNIGHCEIIKQTYMHGGYGEKIRYICENPGASLLKLAHRSLAEISLDDEEIAFAKIPSCKFSDLIFEGRWFSKLRSAIHAYFASMQSSINGTVRIKLQPFSSSIIGRSHKIPTY